MDQEAMLQAKPTPPTPKWLSPQNGTSIQPNQIFEFLGIHFAFQASPKEIWEVVVQWVEKKIDKWITKHMALAPKFQIYTKSIDNYPCLLIFLSSLVISSLWTPQKGSL